MTKDLKLVPHFGLITLTIYGVGDILGAGIYALVGKIAGIAGSWIALSFLIAFVTASLTAMSYVKLTRAFPHAGGVAVFADKIFKRAWLSSLVGWLMFCSCVASMATISKAFFGYLQAFAPGAAEWIVIPTFFVALAFVNWRGMRDSSAFNIVCTLVEVSGLMLVIGIGTWIVFGGSSSSEVPIAEAQMLFRQEDFAWAAILQAAALSFYAFVGFEDLANVSEETKDPTRTVPRAIIAALAIAGVIYMIISFIALKVVPLETLTTSKAPLLEIVKAGFPNFPPIIFTMIAGFAVANTAFLNYITASRLLYGMSKAGLVPSALSKLDKHRSTPTTAIIVILPIVVLLALTGAIQFLAGTTATLMLLLFIVVNICAFHVSKTHRWAPIAAVITNVMLIYFASYESHRLAAVLIAFGFILFFVTRALRKKR